jgi:mannose-6-phosphate isomerase class I
MANESEVVSGWQRDPTPLRLVCGVQHYDWGERGAQALIPRLLGESPGAGRPYAELWIGAHPALPASVALAAAPMTLIDLIERAPEVTLGAGSIRRFGRELPFLMKVLTAERPLSIQAHPDRAQAEAGFAREEAARIPRDAPHRSYRDRNHKPELIVALADFFALEGFRPVGEIAASLGANPELAGLLADPVGAAPVDDSASVDARAWLRRLFERCLSPVEAATGAGLQALLDRLDHEASAAPPGRDDPRYWLLRTARLLPPSPSPDRGLLCFYLLNLVHLRAGEALFLTAGEPHAYLEGRGLEVMASSDNVLRGGLTPKHIDLPELMRVLTFGAHPAQVLQPDSEGRYVTSADEFEARMSSLAPGGLAREAHASSATLLLVVEGEAVLEAGAHQIAMATGQAWFIPAAIAHYRLRPVQAGARVFSVTVPAS